MHGAQRTERGRTRQAPYEIPTAAERRARRRDETPVDQERVSRAGSPPRSASPPAFLQRRRELIGRLENAARESAEFSASLQEEAVTKDLDAEQPEGRRLFTLVEQTEMARFYANETLAFVHAVDDATNPAEADALYEAVESAMQSQIEVVGNLERVDALIGSDPAGHETADPRTRSYQPELDKAQAAIVKALTSMDRARFLDHIAHRTIHVMPGDRVNGSRQLSTLLREFLGKFDPATRERLLPGVDDPADASLPLGPNYYLTLDVYGTTLMGFASFQVSNDFAGSIRSRLAIAPGYHGHGLEDELRSAFDAAWHTQPREANLIHVHHEVTHFSHDSEGEDEAQRLLDRGWRRHTVSDDPHATADIVVWRALDDEAEPLQPALILRGG